MSQDPVIQRLQRLKRATEILREEYIKIDAKLPAYREAHEKWKQECQDKDMPPTEKWRTEPREPQPYQAENRAKERIVDELEVTDRTMKEYMKVAKRKLTKT